MEELIQCYNSTCNLLTFKTVNQPKDLEACKIEMMDNYGLAEGFSSEVPSLYTTGYVHTDQLLNKEGT